jgi:hypothetical protein
MERRQRLGMAVRQFDCSGGIDVTQGCVREAVRRMRHDGGLVSEARRRGEAAVVNGSAAAASTGRDAHEARAWVRAAESGGDGLNSGVCDGCWLCHVCFLQVMEICGDAVIVVW